MSQYFGDPKSSGKKEGNNLELDLKLEQLIKGQVQYKSANLGLNLLISRLQRRYTAKQTPEEMKSCLQEMKAFVEKYSLLLAKDIEAIKGL